MNDMSNIPLSEQWERVADEWADLDGAARMLEESKTAVQSQMMKRLGDVPAAHAERDVKASPEWRDYIEKMVRARTASNKKKIQMEFLKMRFAEWNSAEANRRAGARL